jgi:hypothetical protein
MFDSAALSAQQERAEDDRGDEADNDQDNEPEFYPLVGGQDFPFHRGLRFFAGLLFLRPPAWAVFRATSLRCSGVSFLALKKPLSGLHSG